MMLNHSYCFHCSESPPTGYMEEWIFDKSNDNHGNAQSAVKKNHLD